MIDWHMLIHPTQQRAGEAALELESLGHTVWRVPGLAGHIGRGRALGFGCGRAEWVAFVDDDDNILPDGITAALDLLGPDIDGVCTAEMTSTGRVIRAQARRGERLVAGDLPDLHHIVILRRSVIDFELLERCADYAEYSLLAKLLLCRAKLVYSPEPAYLWRVHKDGARALRINPTEETRRLMAECMRRR